MRGRSLPVSTIEFERSIIATSDTKTTAKEMNVNLAMAPIPLLVAYMSTKKDTITITSVLISLRNGTAIVVANCNIPTANMKDV